LAALATGVEEGDGVKVGVTVGVGVGVGGRGAHASRNRIRIIPVMKDQTFFIICILVAIETDSKSAPDKPSLFRESITLPPLNKAECQVWLLFTDPLYSVLENATLFPSSIWQS